MTHLGELEALNSILLLKAEAKHAECGVWNSFDSDFTYFGSLFLVNQFTQLTFESRKLVCSKLIKSLPSDSVNHFFWTSTQVNEQYIPFNASCLWNYPLWRKEHSTFDSPAIIWASCTFGAVIWFTWLTWFTWFTWLTRFTWFTWFTWQELHYDEMIPKKPFAFVLPNRFTDLLSMKWFTWESFIMS